MVGNLKFHPYRIKNLNILKLNFPFYCALNLLNSLSNEFEIPSHNIQEFTISETGKCLVFIEHPKIFDIIQSALYNSNGLSDPLREPRPGGSGEAGETSASPLLSKIHYLSQFPGEI